MSFESDSFDDAILHDRAKGAVISPVTGHPYPVNVHRDPYEVEDEQLIENDRIARDQAKRRPIKFPKKRDTEAHSILKS